MLSTFASYNLLARDIDRSLALKSAERPVALETQYYLKKIGDVKSIDDFVKDTRLFRYAMKAFGLEDMAHAKGMMRKVLEGGVADEKSFANRLNDERFLGFATIFDFARNGAATTAVDAARQGVVERYVRQSLEISAGEENEGVRLALYFQRAAPEIDSVYGLLADPALWKVAQTIFGFPNEMAAADIEKQGAAIEKRLDIATLKDPAKLDRLIERFTTMWDISESAAPAPILSLFRKQSPTVGIELAMTLTNLRRGGF